MNQTSVSVVFFLSILAIATSAPRRHRRSVPSWHRPCGELRETEAVLPGNQEELRTSLESIKLQHQLTMTDYLNRDYEFLYERARVAFHKHQYTPNWVPGHKDVDIVKKLVKSSSQMIANHLPKMHLDLQKFAVAFEELIEDETDPKILDALKATQSYLMMMLCEVESNIVLLPSLRIPARIDRSIMPSVDRDPIDDTRRLVRDWSILLKYKNYLHGWRHVFDY